MRAFAALLFTALPAMAQDLPPGLESARLLPGWQMQNGNRMVALELRLEPGWKTYWRSPGDTGVPPTFDWSGSENLGQVTLHWPRPEVILSGGETTLGYHETLVLPIEIAPDDAARPLTIRGTVDFGLCYDICVPAHAGLEAGLPQVDPDPAIRQALAMKPALSSDRPSCRVDEIDDGLRVTARLPVPDGLSPDAVLAMELRDSSVWVSQPEMTHENDSLTGVSEFVDASGKPFALDREALRFTLISAEGAVEYSGCQTEG